MRIVALLATLLFSFCCQAQTVYRDDGRRFSLTIPAGWVSSPELLKFTIDELAGHSISGPFVYVAAFVPEGESTDETPYAILQYTPGNFAGASYEAIEKKLNATSFQKQLDEKAQEFKDVIGDITLGNAVLDRSTNRVYMRMAAQDGVEGQMWHGMSAMTLTNHGMVQVNTYAAKNSSADPVSITKQFLAGLTLDPGTEFVAAAPSTATSRALNGGLSGAMRGAIIGLSIGAAMGVFGWLKNRGK